MRWLTNRHLAQLVGLPSKYPVAHSMEVLTGKGYIVWIDWYHDVHGKIYHQVKMHPVRGIGAIWRCGARLR